ncbi:MAG: glycyl-radical enzyme activating protein [Desulfobacterales bacterium]|nr:glycyl-radical enzyme activating protein [Desulfobacterales bacterium]
MPVSGRILQIERLSPFDGDGLRTVVFLKGCPLACRWCSTPESQRQGVDFGVSRNKCTGCFSCVAACPEAVLEWDVKAQRFTTDPSQCTDCRACIHACPAGARTAWGYTATTEEIFNEVQKDSLFYFHSGGGVTVSGGEPLMQAEFVSELLEKCLEIGINTAVETSGQVPWKHIKSVLPLIDTLFYDLKHMDDSRHAALTGAGNTRILNNLRQIDASGDEFNLIVRMPVIPGLNDDNENINALRDVCSGLSRLSEIQLLPYHRLGIETYRSLSVPYLLENLSSPGMAEMNRYADGLRQAGLTVKIGG